MCHDDSVRNTRRLMEEIALALKRMGLLDSGTCPAFTAFPGGVSSDIWRVDLPGGPACIKRALSRLRVSAEWHAEEALEYLTKAIEMAGLRPFDQVAIALDIAASEFARQGRYTLSLDGVELDSEAFIEHLAVWIARYPIVSARSGETEDTTIVHLAIGWGVQQLKVGSFARSERMAKWNESLRVESALGEHARFAGAAALGGARCR